MAKLNPDDRLELKRDIQMPDRYYRAGTTKTRAEWLDLFPKIGDWNWNDWFFNLSDLPPQTLDVDLMGTVINQVFEKHNLHSISYKQATREAIERYIARVFPNQ